jgi:hypothetical protein
MKNTIGFVNYVKLKETRLYDKAMSEPTSQPTADQTQKSDVFTNKHIETFTPKQILSELLPARYGKLVGEFKVVYPDQITDGCVGGVAFNNEVLATFRVRFTNNIVFYNDYEHVVLEVKFTDIKYIKEVPQATNTTSNPEYVDSKDEINTSETEHAKQVGQAEQVPQVEDVSDHDDKQSTQKPTTQKKQQARKPPVKKQPVKK